MVLFIVGLGLGDEKDITVRGLECVKSCTRLYLEYYTSILGIDHKKLEAFYGVPIVLADRAMVESDAEQIYLSAENENIGFLVVGDPLCATTHTDLILRAKAKNIKVEVVHNTSVMGASASCGLQLYQFGYTISIPLFEGSWRPASFYDRIKYNRDGGMHTLCLLDIKVNEPDYESMSSGRLKYLPPRFMTINVAIEQLLEVEADKQLGFCTESTLAVGMARLGQSTQKIVFGTLRELLMVDFGPPLHSLALCGETHPLESEILEYFKVKEEDMVLEFPTKSLKEREEDKKNGDDEDDEN
jgi:diphthine synthase